MVTKGFYPSFSEAIRIAVWDLLEELMFDDKGELNDIDEAKTSYVLQSNEKFRTADRSLSGGQKVATSAKFPMKILKKIDSLVLNGHFKNRSDFIRKACTHALITDSEIFSGFIE
ncbi:MAG: ribbon-helix-helix domain-containing protein [Candidatus Hodarchaeales archaeon]|jgi:Arc/MetJ-type ribon-helix-helix transcriptional regulator